MLIDAGWEGLNSKKIQFLLMKALLASLILSVFIFFNGGEAFADSHQDFEMLMEKWTEKRELASQFLLEAEQAFKEGDALSGCVIQQKAAGYGIEATESLIKAMEVNGAKDGIENLESGLNKWRELRDFC